jgi:hypothetical protein
LSLRAAIKGSGGCRVLHDRHPRVLEICLLIQGHLAWSLALSKYIYGQVFRTLFSFNALPPRSGFGSTTALVYRYCTYCKILKSPVCRELFPLSKCMHGYVFVNVGFFVGSVKDFLNLPFV